MADDIFRQAEALIETGRLREAVPITAAAARAGDARAVFQLALWHLIGEPLPRDLRAARALLDSAAKAGHYDAAMMEIALTANGSGAPADWSRARSLLCTVASANPAAARQLALVAARDIDEAGMPRRLPAAEPFAQRGNVRRFAALLTPDECAHVAATVNDLLEPAVVVDPRTGRQMPHPIRTSDGAVIGPTREDLVVRAINLRIAAVSGTSVDQGESLTVLRYAPGQQYRPHLDTIAGVSNQRIRTVLVYLNEGYEGGETEFPELGITITPRAGDAIVFDNVLPDGRPDPASRHAGLPVRRGVKWLATRWIRARTIDPWNLATAS